MCGGWRPPRQPEAAAIATRLLLLCAGPTAALRRGGFSRPDDPLDPAGEAKRTALAPPARNGRVVTSGWRAARETAARLSPEPAVEPALADQDPGDWAGLPFEAIDPEALRAWIAAPDAGPPGGESLVAVVARVAPWLDRLRGGGGAVVAVTHPAVVRAALACALDLPVVATLAIDVAPLSVTRLSFHDRWRLQELRRA